MRNICGIALALLALAAALPAEDGYEAWLRYRPIADPGRLEYCRTRCAEVVVESASRQWDAASAELARGLSGLLDRPVPRLAAPTRSGAVVLHLQRSDATGLPVEERERSRLREGFLILSTRVEGHDAIVISSQTERGLLYGVFHFLRMVELGAGLDGLSLSQAPTMPLRMINHWDNLDGRVERGYAGRSIYRWDHLPVGDTRYRDYARLLASVGINAVVVNNVNASPRFLAAEMLEKAAVLADSFRPYGITLYLSANFAAPIALGGLSSADPQRPEVAEWWRKKAEEIYALIPDFGGFLVKANSEGQPGPLDYGRSHADGANLLARAVAPHGGIVIWRAFVYDARMPDRAMEAFREFAPLDGQFDRNVILQVKNGPVDFQIREPVHPLFGQMTKTNAMLELQITQEYTGRSTHLVYLVPTWKEVLDFDTFGGGRGSSVKRLVSGQVFPYPHCGMAGVANVGLDRNWTGHHFAAANLYGYGRLAWNPDLSSEEIAEEWAWQTWGQAPGVVETVLEMMLPSAAIYEKYTSPLGVGVICNGNHYDPAPARRTGFHRADAHGVGFDRTRRTGSRFTAQYRAPNTLRFDSLETCPEELLLFFHHVPYTHRLKSGKTVIQHIYDTHFEGVEEARGLLARWESLEGRINPQRHREVRERLLAQIAHAEVWRDAINGYFHELSHIPDAQGRLGP